VRSDEGVVKLTSDGACPLGLANSLEEVRLSRRGIFGEGDADGICVGFLCRPGRVTLARLARIKGEYNLHIASGEAYLPREDTRSEELEECGFPYWPHAFIRLDGNPESFVQNQRSEYISMAYGDLTRELVDLCYLLDIETSIT
jgi:L-fucose isomerase-like protein